MLLKVKLELSVENSTLYRQYDFQSITQFLVSFHVYFIEIVSNNLFEISSEEHEDGKVLISIGVSEFDK
jgi:hypothetical protein